MKKLLSIPASLFSTLLLLSAAAFVYHLDPIFMGISLCLALLGLVHIGAALLFGPGRPLKHGRVYVASAVDNWPAARRIQVALRKAGYEITHDWTQSIYDGTYLASAPQSQEDMQKFAKEDLRGVVNADAVVMLAPAARGSHMELGAALAMGCKCIVLANYKRDICDSLGRPCVFYFHPNCTVVTTVVDVLKELER